MESESYFKTYETNEFRELNNLFNSSETVRSINMHPELIKEFSYNLIFNSYYPIIIDDYIQEITGKYSFYEALYYQAKLITMHSENIEALSEALRDLFKRLTEFNGIVFIFRDYNKLDSLIGWELHQFEDVINLINKEHASTKFYILKNKNFQDDL